MPSEQEMEALEDERAWFEAHGTPLHGGDYDDAPPEPAFTDEQDPALPLWRWGRLDGLRRRV